MTTFILRTDVGTGTRLAVKDLINVAGLPTTAGCRAKAETAEPADADAACLAEIRRRITAGTVQLVGKTNMHELAYGTTGRNPWFGTPQNPLDANRVPGGSSSGSATAVAASEADVALGSDTGGSVRIPAACCGVVGLKTTWGRIPTAGTWPLAPSLDTIGPIAGDVARVVDGMRMLEPGFEPARVDHSSLVVHRLAVPADPEIDRAVDDALRLLDAAVIRIELPGWQQAWRDAATVLAAEAWRTDRDLLQQHPSGVSETIAARLRAGSRIDGAQESAAWARVHPWRRALASQWTSATVVALPTLAEFPPAIDIKGFDGSRLTLPVNWAGLPALALPVPTRGPIPASLQLIGPENGEEVLVAVGRMIEFALS